MKKFYVLIAVFFNSYASFASRETVCVVTNSGSTDQACTASGLGFIDPCITVPFIVNITNVPSGYAIVGKFEWFVNGIPVKSTTNPGDPILNWPIASKLTSVYCKVTYKKQNGAETSPSTSTTFTPNIKDLNFSQTISISTPLKNIRYLIK
jgi:hypothetical protein